MDFKKICKRSDYVDISGDISHFMNQHRWHSLVMTKGAGKTTLLSMLYYFFDLDEDSCDLFMDKAVAREWDGWQEYLNKRVAIALDFSDFKAKNMNAALQYLRLKMLQLYKEKLHLILKMDENSIERYMETLLSLEDYDPEKQGGSSKEDVPEGMRALEYSLQQLLWDFYHGEYSKENPVLLIDNLCRMEQVASSSGYYWEMIEFLKKYLDFEPDKMCCVYLQVWDADSDRRYEAYEYYCYNPPFMPHVEEMYWRTGRKAIRYPKAMYKASIRDGVRLNTKRMENLISQGTILKLKNQNRWLQSEKEYRKQKMEKYSMPLSGEVPLYSDNMGRRYMRHLKRDERYETLNGIVRDLYERSRGLKNYRELYELMQNVNFENRTDWDEQAYAELEEECNGLREGWKVRLHSSGQYWYQIDIGDGRWSGSIFDIKVYVTTAETAVKDLYIGSAKELVLNGKDGFTSMVSRVQRDGTICYFVSRRDFFVLENYLQAHVNELRKGNPFIAHRGLLGISRELMDLDSHNAQQAKILWNYFQMTGNLEEIDIEDMYRMFVMGWNAELAEDNPFRKDFEESTAQMFVLLMDSLDIMLGDKELGDDSLFLNDDKNIWNMLAHARCWGEVLSREE